MVAVTVYSGFCSKRLLYSCGAIMILAVFWSELVRFWDLYPMVVVPQKNRPLPLAITGLSTAVVIGYLLRRSLNLSESVFHFLGSALRGQQDIVTTIKQIHPEIDASAREIEQISSKVASQSAQQASTTSEMSQTTRMMQENALLAVQRAEETNVVAKKTRTVSMENSRRLRKIEKSFDDVVTTISTAAGEVTDLAKQMEQIEEILDFNRKIGEQIKVLAINAAIEADRAGELGKGFGAVAAEFKNMIRDTEKNIAHSSHLLQTIRDKARESSLIIINGSSQLARYFDDLQTTGRTVEQNTERFYVTAKQVAKIAEAAGRQQEGIAEVSSTMAEIDRASADLRDSAQMLVENVGKIMDSERQLEQVLANG
jgi:methyl-accepting chemotaxis protein